MRLRDALFRFVTQGHARWYRATGGRLAGKNIVLLTTTGRRTGRTRVTPLMGIEDGENYLVAGSVGGAPTHPGWYHNLVADPRVTVQAGSTIEQRTARVAEGDERDRLFDKFVDASPQFAAYQDRTDRIIPVVVLEP